MRLGYVFASLSAAFLLAAPASAQYPPQYPPQPAPQRSAEATPENPQVIPDSVLGPYVRPPYAGEGDEDARPEYVRLKDRGKRTHDGLYFRFAGGIGTGSDTGEAQSDVFTLQRPGVTGDFSSSPSGFAGGTQLGIGFSVVGGLVLGLSLDTTTLVSPTADGVAPSLGSYEYATSELVQAGPLIDFYVFPHAGLHVQGSFGFAAYISGEGQSKLQYPRARAHTSTGFGMVLGAGYEWWVADQWGLGLMGRFNYGWTSGTDGDSVEWTDRTRAFLLMLSATYQ